MFWLIQQWRRQVQTWEDTGLWPPLWDYVQKFISTECAKVQNEWCIYTGQRLYLHMLSSGLCFKIKVSVPSPVSLFYTMDKRLIYILGSRWSDFRFLNPAWRFINEHITLEMLNVAREPGIQLRHVEHKLVVVLLLFFQTISSWLHIPGAKCLLPSKL